MQAVNSIHITNGFHASASVKLHLHTGNNYINNLINEEWTEDDYKNKANKNKTTTTSNINISETENITIYPNPSNGIYTINLNNQYSIINIQLTDLTGKTVYLKNKTGNNISKKIAYLIKLVQKS